MPAPDVPSVLVRLVHALDAAAFRVARVLRTRGPVRTAGTLLLVSPGGGNVGDDALAEAAVAHRRGPVRVVGGHPDPDVLASRAGVPVEHLGDLRLLRTNLLARFPDVVRFARAVGGVERLDVIGADVMDGGYGWLPSVQRWSLAARAARSGVPTRILGFSWSDTAHPAAARAMRSASPHVTLLARDPVSHARLLAAGAPGVRLAADIAFTLTDRMLPPDLAEWAGRQRAMDRRILAVNVSGLIAHRIDQLPAFAALVADRLAHRWSVLVVPHVRRSQDDDHPECERLWRCFAADPRVHLVRRGLSPSEVRGIGAAVDLTVTGRMHMSVLGLSVGTPSVVLATQGKTEGLAALAHPLVRVVHPRPGFAEELLVACSAVADQPTTADRAAVPARLRALALDNFAP